MIHAAYRTIFTAPIGAILAGIVGDVPRYEREKALPAVTRSGSSRENSALSQKAAAMRSQIVDVLKSAPLVLDALGLRNMDANAVAYAVDSKRSTVYKALYFMLDVGKVRKVEQGKLSVRGRSCVEWEVV